MERIDGDVADANAFASGFFHDATDEQRATIVDEILKALGEVHAIDWQGRGLEAHCAKASGRFDTDSGVTIGTPMNGEPCDPGNGTIISFTVKSREHADAWYAAGIANGGSTGDFPAREKLAADESRCKAFVDKSLRYKSMFGGTARATAKEFDYRGVTFPANTMITISLTFTGQDPKFNDNPTSFSPDRKTCKHIAFGDGAHIYLGRFLATAMIEEALPIIVKHFPRPRIVGELEYVGPFGA